MSMIGSADVAPASAAFRRGASSNAAEVPMNWRRDRFEQRPVYMAYLVYKAKSVDVSPFVQTGKCASSAGGASCHHNMTLVDSSPHEPAPSPLPSPPPRGRGCPKGG